jgi:hypothetical protein
MLGNEIAGEWKVVLTPFSYRFSNFSVSASGIR